MASFASSLKYRGLLECDRVGILNLNCTKYFEACLAVPRAGFCIIPMNTRWAVPENSHAIDDSGTRALLFDDGL